MTTYTQILYHIIFATKFRKPTLTKSENRQKLYANWSGLISNRKSKALIINGVEDHVHMLVNIHPTISVSNLVKELKNAGSIYIRENHLFPSFTYWQNGYGAFTYSNEAIPRLCSYIENQEQHHAKKSPKEELREILLENGVEWNEEYMD